MRSIGPKIFQTSMLIGLQVNNLTVFYCLLKHWVYDHEIFNKCQALFGGTKSTTNFEMAYLVCKS